MLLYLSLEMDCSIAVLFTAEELAVCIAWDWGVDVDVCLWCMCGVCVWAVYSAVLYGGAGAEGG